MSGSISWVVNLSDRTKVPIVLAPELVTFPAKFPVTFPVTFPVKAVAVTVPSTCNFVVGVAVPIPTLDSAPSKVINVVVVPPSFTLKVISVSCIKFEITAPLVSTVNDKSLSVPITTPPSFATVIVPDVVSLALDLKKLAAATPPSASESVAVPWNLRSEIAVESVIPFLILANPDIETFGVKVSSDIIAMRFPSLNNFVMFCVVSVESKIESNVKPFVVPVLPGGPTKIDDAPL